MTHTMQTPNSQGPLPDKFDTHYRQQLSALVDGELAADEARFMLRRLGHDAELAGCHERWQLLGDVLRGQACAPAPAGFGERVRLAVAADVGQDTAPVPSQRRRQGWKRWGGGAALAASVAMVAMFMTREQLPEEVPPLVIASSAEVPAAPAPVPSPSPSPSQTLVADAGLAAAAVPAAAVAAASRRQEASRRGSATRTQQAARSVAARQAESLPAVAVAQPVTPAMPLLPATRNDPFGDVAQSLPARPWPRSSVAPSLSQDTFNASLSGQESPTTFYPFEPRLPVQDPSPSPERLPGN